MLSLRSSLALVVLAGGAVAQDPAVAAPATRPPNVVLIVADDLGYAELGCQGNTDIPTPSIDSIAKAGVRFTQGYVTCPVCGPTRAGLLTGRYQQRMGFEFNPGPQAAASLEFGLPQSERTLAERLRQQGYATGMVGKWHLGYREGLRPSERGFDEFFGFLAGAHPYSPFQRGKLLRGTDPVDEKAYLTDALAREAVAFVERHKDEPFFLYLAFNAVHTPMQAPAARRERFAAIEDEKRRMFAAMLSALDDGVGAVLGKLRERQLEERTLVIFLSDNGGPTPQTTSSNAPLRGVKAQVFEGGIRVPFLVQWKGTLPEGLVYEAPVVSLDVLPTVLAAAGLAPAKDDMLDGVDLAPWLNGKLEGRPHEALFWRFGAQSAARLGDYKLVKMPGQAAALFDLAKDPGEKDDLAATSKDKVAELTSALEAWSEQLIAPKWKRERRR